MKLQQQQQLFDFFIRHNNKHHGNSHYFPQDFLQDQPTLSPSNQHRGPSRASDSVGFHGTASSSDGGDLHGNNGDVFHWKISRKDILLRIFIFLEFASLWESKLPLCKIAEDLDNKKNSHSWVLTTFYQ